jgi:hypothetical protein
MKRRSGDQSSTDCSVAWQFQNGRSRVQRSVVADGFRGEYPYAGVVVVAENINPDEDASSSITVETVRDVFAEGVAFGIEDALKDSFLEASEIILEKKLSGCSTAAIAFSGTHVWYALTGNCRIYCIDADTVSCIVPDQSAANETGMSPDHADYYKKIRELKWWLGAPGEGKPVCGQARLKRETTFLILTAGGWTHFEHTAPSILRKGAGRTLNGWLSILARDLKLAYRRQGGAIAAVSGIRPRVSSSVSWKYLAYAAAFIALMGFLVFGDPFSCNSKIVEKIDLFATDTLAEEIVQPLGTENLSGTDTTRASTGSGFLGGIADNFNAVTDENGESTTPDISSDLPLQVVQVGESDLLLNPDTFAVSLNSEPDLQWENFAPGIYPVRGDTASFILAEAVRALHPELEIIELDRIITVRESGVAESARWLSELSSESAAGTGVVVETSSSVAGGANWIRNFPVFTNGNRILRQGEAAGFAGDSLPGLPCLRNPRSYRLVIIL